MVAGVEDLAVCEADHLEPEALEVGVAAGVVLGSLGMDAAVEFDDEGGFQADEVDDEGADRALATPLPAFQASGAKDCPEANFGFGLVAPETAGAVSAKFRW